MRVLRLCFGYVNIAKQVNWEMATRCILYEGMWSKHHTRCVVFTNIIVRATKRCTPHHMLVSTFLSRDPSINNMYTIVSVCPSFSWIRLHLFKLGCMYVPQGRFPLLQTMKSNHGKLPFSMVQLDGSTFMVRFLTISIYKAFEISLGVS